MSRPPPPPPPDFDDPEPDAPSALGETLNVAEPAAVKKQVKRKASKQRDAAEFWQAILATEEGRAELWGVLAMAGTFDYRAGVTANGSYDPTLSAFHAGQKSLGNHLFHTWLGYDKEGVLQMLIEHQGQAIDAAKGRRATKTPTGAFTATKMA